MCCSRRSTEPDLSFRRGTAECFEPAGPGDSPDIRAARGALTPTTRKRAAWRSCLRVALTAALVAWSPALLAQEDGAGAYVVGGGLQLDSAEGVAFSALGSLERTELLSESEPD